MENMEQCIQNTKNEALNEEDFNKTKEMQDDLAQAYLDGHINSDEYELLYDSEGRLEKGVAEFVTPEEFKKALELLGLDQETVDELFAHEIEHYNTDLKNGLRPKFILQFCRLTNGQTAIIPAVLTQHKDEDETQNRQKIKESISAPKDLSDSDKRKLNLE